MSADEQLPKSEGGRRLDLELAAEPATEEAVRQEIQLTSNEEAYQLFGQNDVYLKLIADKFDCKVASRGNKITLKGSPAEVEAATSVFETLVRLLRQGEAPLSESQVRYAIRLVRQGDRGSLREMSPAVIVDNAQGQAIRAQTVGQERYIQAMHDHDITFSIGPAGTGKTYLAMAMAVAALKSRGVNRIILTRPAVEAGEQLGFLPGDMQEKVDPYLRPLYDALAEILGPEVFDRYMDKGMIEVAPLAYMRGRTLDNSYVILDEAQNTSPEQMKMFLTRLGFGSKAVVTGDVTQVDLPRARTSGLKQVLEILAPIEGIALVELTDRDVVRHPLVQDIINAYEEHERELEQDD